MEDPGPLKARQEIGGVSKTRGQDAPNRPPQALPPTRPDSPARPKNPPRTIASLP